MCQYRTITYSCGHTVHSSVRNSQQCGGIPCSYTGTPIAHTTTYHWCPPCNRGESATQGHRRANLRCRRSAQIEPSDIAAAIARENARVRRARNISVPEPASIVIPPPSVSRRGHIYCTNASHRIPARVYGETTRREAYGIPRIIEAGSKMVRGHTTHGTHSILSSWGCGIIVFLFCALLFCFLLLYTFSFFAYFLERLVLAHPVWRRSAGK